LCILYRKSINTLRTGWKNPFRWVGTQL